MKATDETSRSTTKQNRQKEKKKERKGKKKTHRVDGWAEPWNTVHNSLLLFPSFLLLFVKYP